MDIREALRGEHSLARAQAIAEYACGSAKRFGELMQCFVDEEYRIAQRAAWSVSWAARRNPGMIAPHIHTIVQQLGRKDVHNAVIRNSVRILEAIEIPEVYHGEVMNACFSFIETPATPPAIKAFALTTLFNLSQQYPEIKPELKLIIQQNWNHETAAFKSRGRKILEKLKAIS